MTSVEQFLREPLLPAAQHQQQFGNSTGSSAQPLTEATLAASQSSEVQALYEELQSREQAVDALRRDAQDQMVLGSLLEEQVNEVNSLSRRVPQLQKAAQERCASSKAAAEKRVLNSLITADVRGAEESGHHQVLPPPGPGTPQVEHKEKHVRVLFNQSHDDAESEDSVQEQISIAAVAPLTPAVDGREATPDEDEVSEPPDSTRRETAIRVAVVTAFCVLAVAAVLLMLPPKKIDECSCAAMTFSTLIASIGGVSAGFLIGRQSQSRQSISLAPAKSVHAARSVQSMSSVLTSTSVLTSRSVLAPLVQTRAVGTQTSSKGGGQRASLLDGLVGIQRQGLADIGMLGEYVDDEFMEQEDSHHDDAATEGTPSEALGSFRSERSMKTVIVKSFRSGQVNDVFEELEWNSDIGMLGGSAKQPLLIMGLHLLDKCDLLNSVPDWMLEDDVTKQVLSDRILAFLHEVGLQYQTSVAYHNSLHACDVMKNVYCLFETSFYRLLMESREWTELISVLAAAVHDVGHPGTTNNFLIASKADLALRYNDKSPLEQMHVSKAFELMRDNPRTDWFNAFRKERMIEKKGKAMPIQNRFRRTLIAMVLATDNLKHNEHVLQLREVVEAGNIEERILGSGSDSNDMRQFALETLLHAADIANCTYELPLTMKWTQRLLSEFWAQGDLEKETFGAATMPMFDRTKMDVPGTQIGFIRFIANGLWQPLVQLLPEFDGQLKQMQRNMTFWEQRKAQSLMGIPNDEEVRCSHRQQQDELESDQACSKA